MSVVKIDMQATVGDVLDRMSIVGVKIDKMGTEPVLEAQYGELKLAYTAWTERIHHAWRSNPIWESECRKTYQQLVDVNTELWDLENEFAIYVNGIREGALEDFPPTAWLRMAKVGLEIRRKNVKRARIKRDIDQLVGHVPEIKQYGDVR